MRVFITGATGFIGSAIVQELLKAGHQVIGLARSDSAAESLTAAGAKVHRGDLQDLDSLRRGAANSDGVIHAGFIHDFNKYEENCEIDRQAIEALGSALTGTDHPLIVTSGTGVLPPGELATEQAVPLIHNSIPRIATEEAAKAVVERGVSVSVVRLPPSVHGDGDHGFVPILINTAREKGVSAYIGDGSNRWCAVHRLDAARLFRLALEKAAARAYYHGVAEEAVTFRQIAEVIGKRLNVPIISLTPDKAANHFGWFVRFAALDVPASSRQTREDLSWHPIQAGLLADVDRAEYFKV